MSTSAEKDLDVAVTPGPSRDLKVMSTKPERDLEDRVEDMVRDRFPEGLIRVLERGFPAATHADYEDAVATGFEKLVVAGRTMENPEGYVTTVAQNVMKRLLRRAAIQQLGDEDTDEHDNEFVDIATDEWDNPTADEPLADDAYRFMLAVVDVWENRSHKATIALVLEAARLEEPLNSTELAEKLEDQLGEEVKPSTARQWRKRGIDRLRRQLIEADLLEEEHS
jgi:hypothetical protein